MLPGSGPWRARAKTEWPETKGDANACVRVCGAHVGRHDAGHILRALRYEQGTWWRRKLPSRSTAQVESGDRRARDTTNHDSALINGKGNDRLIDADTELHTHTHKHTHALLTRSPDMLANETVFHSFPPQIWDFGMIYGAEEYAKMHAKVPRKAKRSWIMTR